jgi:hypothetical protein
VLAFLEVKRGLSAWGLLHDGMDSEGDPIDEEPRPPWGDPAMSPGCGVGGPPSRRAVRIGSVLVGILLQVPVATHADPVYEVIYSQIDTNTTTPQRVSRVWSDARGTYSEQCYAIPGHSMAKVHVSESSYGADHAAAYSIDDDFIITGPAGPATVDAIVYGMLHLDLEHSGAATDNSTRASGTFTFDAEHDGYYYSATGDATSGNGSSYGDGALASYSGGVADRLVAFAATLPVGTPFRIGMAMTVACEANDPAILGGYFAGDLGDAHGHVMDLPPGYTVNSQNWGVVENLVAGAVAAVPPPGEAILALADPMPNPSAGQTTVSYVLPKHGEASLAVLDLQGRVVRLLGEGTQAAGLHRFVWDGRDASGLRVSSGLYFVRLDFEKRTITRRLTWLR